MSDNFLYQIPVLSGRQESCINHIMNEFIDCFLSLNRKDPSVGQNLPETQYVKTTFSFLNPELLNLVKKTYHHIIKSTDFSNDLSFLIKQVQTDFQILFCIHLLVEFTNQYMNDQLKTELRLNADKCYNTFKRRNEKETSLAFLTKNQDISLEDRLYVLSTLCISQLNLSLSSWFIDFFSIYKKKIYGFLQNKKHKLPSSFAVSTTSKLTRERRKKTLNIKLGSSDYQVSNTNHIIKSQSVKLIS